MNRKVKVALTKSIDDSYELVIGQGLLPQIAGEVHELVKANCYVIISDSNVSPLYSHILVEGFEQAGHRVLNLVFPAGEENKSRATKEMLEDKMLAEQVGRDSCILALGGGVTGDLAGFIAATYQRGIPFVQIPTTILAQVDSSIGGKVAVDTPLAKNMIGAFWQPKRVYIDIDTLQSHGPATRLNGIGEIIKHAVIMDKEYFAELEQNAEAIKALDPAVMIDTIAKSCRIKGYVVERDERESGLRKLLNFGHTLGHAVEVLMDFKLLHDQCVGLGCYAEALLSYKLGLLPLSAVERIKALLENFGLPVKLPASLKVEEVLTRTYLDKKVRKSKVEYALPTAIGRAEHGIIGEDEVVLEVLKALQM